MDALWETYRAYFDAERHSFDRSLASSSEVLRFYDRVGGALVGMTLLSAWDAEHQGRSFRVVSTGAVCVRPEYRGANAIQSSGLWWLAREKLRTPRTELWWYFDTFSFRSYLLLPRNLAVYWPRRETPTPPWERQVLAKLTRRQVGDAWDEQREVIRSQGRRLRPGVADAPRADPDEHIRFFLEANPGHATGERLPCLVPLSLQNVVAIVQSSWRRLRRAAPASPGLAIR